MTQGENVSVSRPCLRVKKMKCELGLTFSILFLARNAEEIESIIYKQRILRTLCTNSRQGTFILINFFFSRSSSIKSSDLCMRF